MTRKVLFAAVRGAPSAMQRQPVHVYIDEFHKLASGQPWRLLSSARKFNVGITLANQRLDALPRAGRESLLGSAGHLAFFRQGREPAYSLEDLF